MLAFDGIFSPSSAPAEHGTAKPTPARGGGQASSRRSLRNRIKLMRCSSVIMRCSWAALSGSAVITTDRWMAARPMTADSAIHASACWVETSRTPSASLNAEQEHSRPVGSCHPQSRQQRPRDSRDSCPRPTCPLLDLGTAPFTMERLETSFAIAPMIKRSFRSEFGRRWVLKTDR